MGSQYHTDSGFYSIIGEKEIESIKSVSASGFDGILPKNIKGH